MSLEHYWSRKFNIKLLENYRLNYLNTNYVLKNYTFFMKPMAAPIVVKKPAKGKITTAYFFGI